MQLEVSDFILSGLDFYVWTNIVFCFSDLQNTNCRHKCAEATLGQEKKEGVCGGHRHSLIVQKYEKEV